MELPPSDLSRSAALSRQGSALSRQVQTLATELTSGLSSQPSRVNGGEAAKLHITDTYLTRLQADRAVLATADERFGAARRTLETIQSEISPISAGLLAATEAGDAARANILAQDASSALELTWSGLSTSYGGRALFGGTEPNLPILPALETMLTSAKAAIAGGPADSAFDTLQTFFAEGGAFELLHWGGGAAIEGLTLASGHTVGQLPTALDPAFREMLTALVGAHLSQDAAVATTPEAALALQAQSAEALITADTNLVTLTAAVGGEQGRLGAIDTLLAAEESTVEMTRAALFSADPYETAAALTEAEARLEALYTITSRLSRLSLSRYL
ncbi:MAG: hypothetical protein AAFQ36_02645 [Pseudomonadota bacterium]